MIIDLLKLLLAVAYATSVFLGYQYGGWHWVPGGCTTVALIIVAAAKFADARHNLLVSLRQAEYRLPWHLRWRGWHIVPDDTKVDLRDSVESSFFDNVMQRSVRMQLFARPPR